MNPISIRKPRSLATFLGAFAFVALLPSVALGAVKKEGAWPDADKPITVDASGLSRSEAVRRVAEAAGWNVVVHAPAGDPIDIHVKNQPAGKVLDLVLNDAAYVARRDGTLIDIQREDAGSAATTQATDANDVAPAAVPIDVQTPPHERLSDREFLVLRHIASGKTPTAIAKELGLSVKTISTYRMRILEKMSMANNAELTHYAIQNQLVQDVSPLV